MHPEFPAIINFVKENKGKTKVVVQSNGVIKKYIKQLVGAIDIVHLSFEIDGSDVRISSVNEVINIAQLCKDVGIYSYFFATVHPGNLSRIDEMVEVATNAGVDIGFNICVSGHREQLQLSPAEYLQATKKLNELSKKKKTLRFTSPYASILNDMKSDQYVGNRGGCTAGIAACVVLPDGDVVPCPFFRVSAGNIYEKELEKIWLGSKLFSDLRNRSLYEEPCGSCQYLSYCGGCRAAAYTEGNLIGGDPKCFLKNM